MRMQKIKRKSKFTPGNYKLRVGRSKTGKGLFAMEDIAKGVCIIEYTGRPATKKEMMEDSGKYLFWTGKHTMINGNVRSNRARYINHSCAPNCESDGPEGRVYIVSVRRIKAGDELTYDYGKEYFNKHIKPYGCKCTKCSAKRLKAPL